MIAPSLFIGSSSDLQVTRTGIKSRTSSKSGQILGARKNVVSMNAPSLLIGSSFNLQVIRTLIKSRMRLRAAKSDYLLMSYSPLSTESWLY